MMKRLDKGEKVSKVEFRREFERVAIVEREAGTAEQLQHRQKTGWKEMIFGRKRTEAEMKKDADELHQAEESIRRADNGIFESSRLAPPIEAVPANSSPRASVLRQGPAPVTPHHPEVATNSKPRKQDTGFVIV